MEFGWELVPEPLLRDSHKYGIYHLLWVISYVAMSASSPVPATQKAFILSSCNAFGRHLVSNARVWVFLPLRKISRIHMCYWQVPEDGRITSCEKG